MSILGMRALGLLETRGLIAAIEASDVMCKAANVTLLHVQYVGAARACVLFAGELGACEAALEAGARAALLQGELTGQRIIARPLDDVDTLLERFCRESARDAAAGAVEEQPEEQKTVSAKPPTSPTGKAAPRRKKGKKA